MSSYRGVRACVCIFVQCRDTSPAEVSKHRDADRVEASVGRQRAEEVWEPVPVGQLARTGRERKLSNRNELL